METIKDVSTMTGILVDVSASMKFNIRDEVDLRNDRIRSVFKALHDLTRSSDTTVTHQIYAIGVGGEKKRIFDFLNTMKDAKEKAICVHLTKDHRPKRDIIHHCMGLLQRNGAPFIYTWVSPNILELYVTKDEALIILKLLKNSQICRRIALECLPHECRSPMKTAGRRVMNLLKEGERSPPHNKIREIIEKIMSHVFQPLDVTRKAIMDVRSASTILGYEEHCKHLSTEQVDQLISQIAPHIFGGSPLNRALREAVRLFDCNGPKKLLFIISDGVPTDNCTPPIKELQDAGVIVVSCLITTNNIQDSRRLYAKKQPQWGEPERYMFDLSSALKTQSIPRTFFIKRGWNFDIEENRVKLFIQINHPDVINEVTEMVNEVLFSQDVLSDLLTSVHLDLYINQKMRRIKAPLQEANTCFATATATVFHLAMHRILGREGGYPKFVDLQNEMIESYGNKGALIRNVLDDMCPKYRLHYRLVNLYGAMTAITEKRPVIATFYLEGSEWDAFDQFYGDQPKGILTQDDLSKKFAPTISQPGGHAVVLVGYNRNSLRFMNSWGCDWADNGFFRVSMRNGNILKCYFYDVFWNEEELLPSEIDEYERNGTEVAQLLMERLQVLQSATHMCHYCQTESSVLDFKGSMEKIQCPTCQKTFSIREAGDNVQLAVYLSLLQVQ